MLRLHVCFVVFVLVFQCLAKRLAGKNVSEMTYFVLGETFCSVCLSVDLCVCLSVGHVREPCKNG